MQNKYKNIFLVSCFLVLNNGFSQMLEIGKKDSVIGIFSSFSVDNLGNSYLCQNDVITKLSPTFDTLFSTSLKSHFPSFIQAVKNFRILTFDQERGIVQFFDNTLTPLTGSLNLYDLNVIQPILVCESFNGNAFWVLDAGTLRLLKVNENFKVITEVENLSFIIEDGQHPTQMFEHNDLLYMLVPERYVMVFDAFGTFIRRINIKTSWLDMYQNVMLYYQFPNFLFFNKLILGSEIACKWPITGVKFFQINSKFLYLLTNAGFYRGMINQPIPTKNK